MNKPVPNATQPYRSLVAGYTEAIRASDLKANIAFLFVAFMMGSVLYNWKIKGELKAEGKVSDLVAQHQCDLEKLFLKLIGYQPQGVS